ncbi:DUF6417 family protein [Streptomyces sp. NPDC088812]|uniref:DUF6417 family protein n=1 Tax=Streptomyces sp. NPDC088812 TaxID=3365905 RepID=UPI003812C1F0
MKSEAELQALHTVEEAAEHGWAVDAHALPLRPFLRRLQGLGLVEMADRETRAALSAWEGRPVYWAARLSAAGRDLLLYIRVRPAPSRAPVPPGRGRQVVELLPSQMDALRVFVGLADRLAVPPADGLAEQVRTAAYDRGAGRWRLLLTQDQMDSVAYAFWLHRLSGSAAEANRFGRDYGLTHQPRTQPLHPSQDPGPRVPPGPVRS